MDARAARLLDDWHKLICLTAVVIALAIPPGARGQTQANWIGSTDGSWTDPTRWSTGLVPNNGSPAGASYAATIAASGTYRVTLNAPVTVNSVTLNNQTATLAVAGTNGNLTIVNSIALQAGCCNWSTAAR